MFNAIWNFLSTEGFSPHGICLLWRPDVFWAHVVSDLIIAISYFSIPTALIYFASKRVDLRHRWMLYLFGAFIVSCGITHIFGIWTMWIPDYGAEAVAKAITAIVSLGTAIALWPLVPKLLAIPSPRQLEEKNAELAQEIGVRTAAEEKLQQLNDNLERLVEDRTQSLQQLNGELARSRFAAEQANRAKSEFLASMSHELRTPLNAILGFSDLMMETGPATAAPEKFQTYSSHIHDSAQHLLALINDVLDLARVESGATDLTEEAIDVPALLSAVVQMTDKIASAKNVTLEQIVKVGQTRLRADPRKLKQILINLVTNAVKYTPDGGKVTLRSWANTESGYIFQIIDTGVGIAPEDIPVALAPYKRVGGDAHIAGSGTGLGLPLSKRLVDLHGGSLDLQSEVGVGTTVTVRFPASRIDAGPHANQDVGDPTSQQ
jgi:signal transduction histidine kinase